MEAFVDKKGVLTCDGVSLTSIAGKHGTPCYIYSTRKLDHQCSSLKQAFADSGTRLCYAVKANSTHAILKRIFGFGFGADVVSGGELHRALDAGAAPSEIVFSGVGKQDWELELGLAKRIGAFIAESAEELTRLDALARKKKRKPSVLLRVNPNIESHTLPYISTGLYANKFGIAESEIDDVVRAGRALSGIQLVGLSCHLGSQITHLDVFEAAAQRMADLAIRLKDGHAEWTRLDLGGGLAVRYENESVPPLSAYAKAVLAGARRAGLELTLEPGRFVVAEAGGLLTRVITVKTTPEKTFAVVDAAMNDLIRPSLYRAYHPVVAVRSGLSEVVYDIVGPVCETGDFLALNRKLPRLTAGDLLLVGICGAYGSVMSSNYNSRPRAPEVWIEKNSAQLIRRREKLRALSSDEI